MPNAIAIDLDIDTRQALDQLAQATNLSVAELVRQAVRDYLELQEWRRRKIETGLAAAERGEFASAGKVERIFAKYSVSR